MALLEVQDLSLQFGGARGALTRTWFDSTMFELVHLDAADSAATQAQAPPQEQR